MIELRPYQSESIDAMRANIAAGHVRQVLASPTGSGKSVMMMEMLRAANEKGTRTMFLCERRILVDQFSGHLDANGIEHGVLMANHWRFRPQASVQVASVQTLERMESFPAFDLLFIDELHAAMRKSVVNLLTRRPNLKVIGATATPFHPLIGKHFTAVTSVRSMGELVRDGNLVPFRVFIAHEIDTAGLKTVAGEWKKDDLEVRGQQIVGDIVADYLRISNEVFGGMRKTICFSCGIAHGAELVQQFSEAGVNAVQLASGCDEEFKAQVLADFARPDSGINVLISVDMLSRGFDQTDIEHVIIARPLKKSLSMHIQMVGRGARAHAGKNLCVIQDHAGNWLRFLNDWNEHYQHGVQALGAGDEKARKEPTKKEKEKAKCPKCSAFWASGSDTCLHCGFVRVRANDVVSAPGEMRELVGSKSEVVKAAKLATHTAADREAWYKGMIALLRSKGNKDGRAFYLYKEKFKVEPPWKKEPGPITQEVVNDLARANIAYAAMHRKPVKKMTFPLERGEARP